MQYEISEQGNSTVLQIKEERFDAKLAPEFRQAIETLTPKLIPVVLDIEDVKFMDSSGLGAVMGVYKLSETDIYVLQMLKSRFWFIQTN